MYTRLLALACISTSLGAWGTGCKDSEDETGPTALPVIGAWVASTSTTNAPWAREDHSAVWTGSKMILWGGKAVHPGPIVPILPPPWPYVNTGGIYNRATDTWESETSTVNAPSERNLHSAIWTGSEMIVWGGSTGAAAPPASDYYNDGHRYDPGSDMWLGTISTTNAPGARSFHTAVWTGSLMIVWGGYDGTNLQNTGGIYEPGTDTWVGATSTVGAPSARLHHEAVWTGVEMIVWGGQDATGNRNDGARYDPGLDSWTPISTEGAPSARQGASAVWTGSEMIIWGGHDVESTNGGAAFNPATNKWSGTTATSGAPAARQSHSAVWTGSEMIVSHGGVYGGSFLNDGGIFDP